MIAVIQEVLSRLSDGFYCLLNNVRRGRYVAARRINVATRVDDIKQRDAVRFPGSCTEALASLAQAIESIREGKHPPLIVIHGTTGCGKTVLAAEMVRNGKNVHYLDAIEVVGGRVELRAELPSMLSRGADVFIIDEANFLKGGMDLWAFYTRCKLEKRVLIIIVQDPRDVAALRFHVPVGTIYYAPDTLWRRVRQGSAGPIH